MAQGYRSFMAQACRTSMEQGCGTFMLQEFRTSMQLGCREAVIQLSTGGGWIKHILCAVHLVAG